MSNNNNTIRESWFLYNGTYMNILEHPTEKKRNAEILETLKLGVKKVKIIQDYKISHYKLRKIEMSDPDYKRKPKRKPTNPAGRPIKHKITEQQLNEYHDLLDRGFTKKYALGKVGLTYHSVARVEKKKKNKEKEKKSLLFDTIKEVYSPKAKVDPKIVLTNKIVKQIAQTPLLQ